MTTTDIHADYRLTAVKEMDGNEGVAFSGNLTHKGKKIATVHNSGNGGATHIRFTDGPASQAADDFRAAAARIIPAQYEPEEMFLERLLTVAAFNRKRGVLLIFEGDNPWETGQVRQTTATAPREQVIAGLQRNYAEKNPRFWDKKRADFLPADEIL